MLNQWIRHSLNMTIFVPDEILELKLFPAYFIPKSPECNNWVEWTGRQCICTVCFDRSSRCCLRASLPALLLPHIVVFIEHSPEITISRTALLQSIVRPSLCICAKSSSVDYLAPLWTHIYGTVVKYSPYNLVECGQSLETSRTRYSVWSPTTSSQTHMCDASAATLTDLCFIRDFIWIMTAAPLARASIFSTSSLTHHSHQFGDKINTIKCLPN